MDTDTDADRNTDTGRDMATGRDMDTGRDTDADRDRELTMTGTWAWMRTLTGTVDTNIDMDHMDPAEMSADGSDSLWKFCPERYSIPQ